MTINIQPQAEPGPYAVRHDTDGCDEVLTVYSVTTGREIAETRFFTDYDPIQNARRESTFRLLAAAPQLQAALTALLASLDYGNITDAQATAAVEARHALWTAIGPAFTSEESFVTPTDIGAV